MPYTPHLLATFRGIFGTVLNPIEEWSFGLRFGNAEGPLSPVAAPAPAIAAALANAWDDFASLSSSRIGTHTVLTQVRIALIGEDGHVPVNPDGTYEQVDWHGAYNGAQVPIYPFQVSMAVTLDTLRPGPSGTGRFYLPGITAATGADGVVLPGTVNAIADNVKTFLDACQGEFAAGTNDLIVASSKGFNSKVTSIRLGGRLDVQRRRGADVPEQHVMRVLAPA
jgi:hypothetical protein